jgi:3-hydroxybutyryl-CoA dehydrogenase
MKIAVIGAGTMGAGIAQVSAAAGLDVHCQDLEQGGLDRGRRMVAESLQRMAAKGRITEDEVEQALSRITWTLDLDEAVTGANTVVEAVFEELAIKERTFAAIDQIAEEGAVLATNTSAIPITAIAAATSRPESVVGTHFFSPVPMMKLCEIVRGRLTSDATVDRARNFAESIGKTCVVVNRDVAGFVTTRLISALVIEAARLVETGVASAEDIDLACQLGFGHTMGPLRTMDLTGIDIMRNAALNVYRETGEKTWLPPELVNRMVEAGELGRKSGRGFYVYEETS